MLKIKIINDFFKLKFSIINNIKIKIKHVLDIPDDLGVLFCEDGCIFF